MKYIPSLPQNAKGHNFLIHRADWVRLYLILWQLSLQVYPHFLIVSEFDF